MPNFIEGADAAATTATAYTLQSGQTAQGTLNFGGDHDWYRVDMTAGLAYTFAMVGTGTDNVRDTYLQLYDSSGGSILASNDDSLQGLNSIFTYTPTLSGTYYLDAAAFDATEPNRQYGVSFTVGTKASFDAQMGAGVIDTDLAWNTVSGTAATVTYGFRSTYSGSETNFAQ